MALLCFVKYQEMAVRSDVFRWLLIQRPNIRTSRAECSSILAKGHVLDMDMRFTLMSSSFPPLMIELVLVLVLERHPVSVGVGAEGGGSPRLCEVCYPTSSDGKGDIPLSKP